MFYSLHMKLRKCCMKLQNKSCQICTHNNGRFGEACCFECERSLIASDFKIKSKKYTIYAVDFDGTLCESIYPGIGSPNLSLIEHLKKRRHQGSKIILWTCRGGKALREAIEWCREYGLEFDAVNKNLPERIRRFGNDSRKVFADVYIDDKCVNKPSYCVPFTEIKNGRS